MRTACLFPGLNTISRDRDRSRFSSVPEVADYLEQLRKRGYGEWLDMSAKSLYNSGDFAALAAITLAIQTGIYQMHVRNGLKPDVLIGCSLGDISRTVCSGAVSFQSAIDIVESFRDIVQQIPARGHTCSVRLPSNQKLDAPLIFELENASLQPSILSDRHFIIGCDSEGLRKLYQFAASHNWQLKDAPFPYALHSRHLSSNMHPLLSQCLNSLHSPAIPVYSTIQLKLLRSASELEQDAMQCFSEPVQWVKSLRKLFEMGVSRFINIGPCMSLPLLLRETQLNIKIETPKLLN